jgi:hypothetical protein
MSLEFLFLLGLVGTGSRWRAGIGYLPAGHSAALKTGKTGVLGADGEPDISSDGKKLSYEEKMAIRKKEKEMRDAEFTTSVMKKHKDKLVPTSLTNEQIDKLKPRKEKATVTREYMGNKTGSKNVQLDIYDDRVAVKKEDAPRGYLYEVQMFAGKWTTPPSRKNSDGMPRTSFKTKKDATEYAKRLLKLRADLTRLGEPDYARQILDQFMDL